MKQAQHLPRQLLFLGTCAGSCSQGAISSRCFKQALNKSLAPPVGIQCFDEITANRVACGNPSHGRTADDMGPHKLKQPSLKTRETSHRKSKDHLDTHACIE
jgi:hypothetical protein